VLQKYYNQLDVCIKTYLLIEDEKPDPLVQIVRLYIIYHFDLFNNYDCRKRALVSK